MRFRDSMDVMKKRDSCFELCRIVTMAIIVLNHVVSLGGGTRK